MRVSKDRVAVGLLAFILAVLSVVSIMILREIQHTQIATEGFAKYMKCLIATDEALYKELGKAGYVEYCEQFLRVT
jgi:hypothetical protein